MHYPKEAKVEITSTIETDFKSFLNQIVSHITQAVELSVMRVIANSNNENFNCQKTSENGQEFLTKKQALDILKISAPTLLRYQKEGLIPYYRVGRKVYFKTSEIAEATKVTLKQKNHRREAKND